jgi:hypothetical protein
MGFASMYELWEISNSSIDEEKEREAVESVELGKKRRFSRIPMSFAFTDPIHTRSSEVLERLPLKDSNNRVISMRILEGQRKVPIRWLHGDSCIPLEPFCWLQMRSF